MQKLCFEAQSCGYNQLCVVHNNSSSIWNITGIVPTGRTKSTNVRPCRPKLH